MIKKKPYGMTLKDQLKAGAKDRLHNFLLAGGAIRGVIMHGTRMVNEMRANHELGILETLVLGRAYLGAGLMSADLKSIDRISLKIDCSGPIKGLVVEANAFGEIRGFLLENGFPENEVDNIQSAAVVAMARDAMLFRKGRTAVNKKAQAGEQPRPMKAGSRGTQPKKSDVDKARKRLRRVRKPARRWGGRSGLPPGTAAGQGLVFIPGPRANMIEGIRRDAGIQLDREEIPDWLR